MSDTAWAESLLTRFVIPLVDGAEVHVGAPLGEGAAERLQRALVNWQETSATGQALQAARRAVLVEIGFADDPPRLSDDVTLPWLLVGLHDLLFLQHPESSRLKPAARAALLGAAHGL